MQALYKISSASWNGPYARPLQEQAIDALEQGKVLFFPDLAFLARKTRNRVSVAADRAQFQEC